MCRSAVVPAAAVLSFVVRRDVQTQVRGVDRRGQVGQRDLDLQVVAATAYAWSVVASLLPTQVAVDATCAPGAFGASLTVLARDPVE